MPVGSTDHMMMTRSPGSRLALASPLEHSLPAPRLHSESEKYLFYATGPMISDNISQDAWHEIETLPFDRIGGNSRQFQRQHCVTH